MPILLMFALAMTSFSTVLYGNVDVDADGMSDVWEKRYGAEGLDPLLDQDADGQSNLDESLAGTDPFDANSRFQILYSQQYSDGVMLRWFSKLGLRYQVERSPNLGVQWYAVGEAMDGNGSELTAVYAKGNSLRYFYRVCILPPELHVGLPAEADVYLGGYDTDNDGIPDLQEVKAGSNPFDPQFDLPSLGVGIGAVTVLEWASVSGKLYRVQKQQQGGTWENVGEYHRGTGGRIVAAVEGAAPVNLRVVVQDIDSDSDGVSDWEEFLTGLDPDLPKTDAKGSGDFAELQAKLVATDEITVRAERAVANITRMEDGGFRIERSGGLGELTVNYTVAGTAVGGTDYVALPGSVVLSFGVDSVVVPVTPMAGSPMPLSESVILTLQVSPTYDLGDKTSQQVNVLKEVAINVTDYGTTGDGVTDDTAAVQSAIDALEGSSVHNTLHFPSGKYRLNGFHYTIHSTGTSIYRILKLGSTDLAGRDLIISGTGTSTLYSTVSPTRAKMLLVMGVFRSLRFYGMKWEKIDTPLSPPSPGSEPNGAAGLAIVDVDSRYIEEIILTGCEFINCHRSVTVDTAGYVNNGKIGLLGFYDSQFINPYGSNTVNSGSAYGGGQQVYISAWVNRAEYLDNYFCGAGENMDANNSPGGVIKDGGHFGSSLQLNFRRNVVRGMAIEALNQVNDLGRMGNSRSGFTMPPADDQTLVKINLGFDADLLSPGDLINYRWQAKNNNFRVASVDSQNDAVYVYNLGGGNEPEGTYMAWNQPIFLQNLKPTEVVIADNVFDGWHPAAAGQVHNNGIVVNASGIVKNNLIYDFDTSVHVYVESRTPLSPASHGLTISGNIVRIADYSAQTISRQYGIWTWGEGQRIVRNKFGVTTGTHVAGIVAAGANAYIYGNRLSVKNVINNGYWSNDRSVGIALYGDASADIVNNATSGFDVGVGPLIPNADIPHRVINHTSVNDWLPVDPKGLIVD